MALGATSLACHHASCLLAPVAACAASPVARDSCPRSRTEHEEAGLTIARDDIRTWWHRPGLEPRDGRLFIAGRDAEALAREHDTPALRVRPHAHRGERARPSAGDGRHRAALEGAVRRSRASASPRCSRRLRSIAAPGTPAFVGLDVCSPGEVRHGLDNGFPASEISYTGTNVSDRDLDADPRRRRAPEPRPHQPDPPLRAARPRGDHRTSRQPPRQRRPSRERHQLLQRRQAHQVRHLSRASRRGARGGPVLRPHGRHRALPRQPPSAHRRPARLRPRRRGGRRDGAPRHRRRLPRHRGQRRRRSGGRHAAGAGAARSRRLRRRTRQAPRAARRHHRLRAGRDVQQERRRAARGGRHRGGPGRRGRRSWDWTAAGTS